MLTSKEKRLINELIIKMEKQNYLSGKFEEQNINKFMIRIFKKILNEEE